MTASLCQELGGGGGGGLASPAFSLHIIIINYYHY